MIRFRKIMAIVYTAQSMFTGCIFTMYIIRGIILLSQHNATTSMIGGMNYPTFLFIFGSPIIMMISVTSSLSLSIINIVFSFKSAPSRKLNWVLFTWLILNMGLLILVRQPSYAASMHLLFEPNSITTFVVIMLLTMIGILTALSLVLHRRKEIKV